MPLVQTAADTAEDALDVSATFVVRPQDSMTRIERALRRHGTGPVPGRWDIIERGLHDGLAEAMHLPDEWFVAFYRLRPVDEVALQHAREAHARARQRAREQGH